jgi:YgiT-type zinc finger domain-containing protein
MKNKKWTDCPSCGAKGSMKLKKGIKEIYQVKNYGTIPISDLSGYECSKCNERIYLIKSSNKINSAITDLKAKKDSDIIVASQLVLVEEFMKKLGKSRQRIHQMMEEGKIQYVYIGNLKFPLRSELNRI